MARFASSSGGSLDPFDADRFNASSYRRRVGYPGSLYRQSFEPHAAEHLDDVLDFGVLPQKMSEAELLGQRNLFDSSFLSSEGLDRLLCLLGLFQSFLRDLRIAQRRVSGSRPRGPLFRFPFLGIFLSASFFCLMSFRIWSENALVAAAERRSRAWIRYVVPRTL